MTDERWEQIRELFHGALDVPAAQRPEWLQARCGGDDELRQEIESLLASDRSGGLEVKDLIDEAAAVWHASPPVPAKMGPYNIQGVIGQGGMGVIYAAVREDDEVGRKVAIKLVKYGAQDPVALERFRHERRMLATLSHANIAQLFDFGTTADGVPYLVMEYIEGRPVDQYCREHRLGVRQRLELFRTICAAVQFAHQRLIVHRDLKPSNILVTESGVAKLVDFGIAKLLQTDDTQTMTGSQRFTPDYASPEQVSGEPVSTLSDVYSLGAILYELLSLQKPHRLKDYSPAQIARAVCTEEPPRPSAAAGSPGLSHQLRGDLDNIVLKAMHKEPHRRYSSAEQLADDLRRYLVGMPVVARPDRFTYRAGKFVSRHRIGLSIVVLVSISLVAAASAAIYQGKRAERRFAQVRKLANTFLFTFHDKIASLQGATEAREMVVKTGLEYLDSLAREAGGDVDLRHELAQAYLRVGDVQGSPRLPNLGHPHDALTSYEKARVLADQLYRRNRSDIRAARLLALAYGDIGDLQASLLGESKKGLANIRSGMDLGRIVLEHADASEQDHADYVLQSNRLGDALVDDDLPAASATYQESLRVARTLVDRWPNPESQAVLATTYERIGRLEHDRGNPSGSLKAFREAETILNSLSTRFPNNGRYRREFARVEGWLGNVSGNPEYFNLGDRRAAVVFYRRAYELAAQLAQSDPKNGMAQLDLAIDAGKLADLIAGSTADEAMTYANQCLSTVDGLSQSQPTFMQRRVKLQCLATRARVESATGQFSRALRTLDETGGGIRKLLDSAPSDLGAQESELFSHQKKAAVLVRLRLWEQARTELRLALESAERLAKQFPKDLYFLRDLSETCEAQSRLCYAQALAGIDRIANLDHALQYANRASALWQNWEKLTVPSVYTGQHRQGISALVAQIRQAARN
jgi:serine/threonine protein kinase